MTKPSLKSPDQQLIAVAKKLRVTPDAVRDVLRGLRTRATTLVAESEKLGVTSEKLRAALRELLGVEVAATLMQWAGDSKPPGTKAFSWKRQKRLEGLLAGQDERGPITQIQASPQTTDEMWRAISGEGSPPPQTRGGNPLGQRVMPSGGGPFDRGNDSRGPFNRR